jgi:hypothetical protein
MLTIGGWCVSREGGVPRFYRGFLMGITRGVPGAAATFATYSIIMDVIA